MASRLRNCVLVMVVNRLALGGQSDLAFEAQVCHLQAGQVSYPSQSGSLSIICRYLHLIVTIRIK